jgi:hypothetical protein
MGVANETFPPTCEATTKYGKPCIRSAQPGKTVCHSHDPAYAEIRKRNARAGGVAVHSPATEEIEDVKATLWELIRETREEVLAPQIGSTVNSGGEHHAPGNRTDPESARARRNRAPPGATRIGRGGR